MEYFPAGLPPDQSGVLLHETGYLPRNDWWVFPNTLSPFWRLYFNARPGHKVVFPNVEYALTPEHIMLIPDHQLFHAVGRGPVPHCWITFQPARRLAARQNIPILLRVTRIERNLLRRLACQFTGIGRGDREAILHTSLALLHLVLIRPEIHWQEGTPPDGLRRAIRRLEMEYAKPLKVADLARTAGLCVRGFAKVFKRYQGVAPARFHTQVRVREAATLLAKTNDSIDQIAEQTGFPNRHYFSRVFKRLLGDSPARFRRRHLLNLGTNWDQRPPAKAEE